MMARAKLIFGLVFGGALAVLAAVIGLQSLGDLAAPTSSFALIADVSSSTTTTSFAASISDVLPVKKAAKKKIVQTLPVIVEKPPASVPAAAPVVPILEPFVFVPPPVAPEPRPPDSAPTAAPPPQTLVAPLPTPVASPAPITAGVVIIAEVMVGSEESGEDEFIELYNPSQQAVDLTGWSINKKTASGKEDNLVAKSRLQNKTIAPSQKFLIAHDGAHLTTATADALWAKSNTLAAKNNAIVLYNAAGAKVDEAVWTEIPKGGSYARVPLMEGGVFSVLNVATAGQ